MSESFLSRIKHFSGRPFLAAGKNVFSYGDFFQKTDEAENVFRRAGIAAGEPVVLIGNYNPDTIATFFALEKIGCVIVPVVDSLPPAEQVERIKISGARRKIIPEKNFFSEKIESAASPAPLCATLQARGHAGLVLFSSGSTGAPKAMVHDLTDMLGKYADRKPKSLPVLAALLFDHIGGVNTLLGALASGQMIVAPENREPEQIASLISGYKVAVLPTTPTFLNLFLLSGVAGRFDLSSLRVISYGTEPMPEALLKRLRAAFPKVKFIETFGTSETGIAKMRSAGDGIRFDDPDTETRVVDGELQIRSRTQILGYLNADAARFTADGWFRTGDRVEIVAGGGMKILGREGDWINVGGEKVFPAEIESAILEMPAVSACRVRGEANPITGQSVVAEIIPAAGVADVEALRREVRIFCRGKLSSFKVPTRVLAVTSLPVSERGKKMRN